MINTSEEAASYMASRFWKGYFDSLEVWQSPLPKQALNDAIKTYISVIWDIPFQEAIKAQEDLTKRLSTYHAKHPEDSLYDYFSTSLRNALYGANSDFRNEDYYIPVLQMLCNDPSIDETAKQTYRFELEKCRLNMTGSQAADFSYTEANGRNGRLYSIDKDYILILFSNPGCQACASIIGQITGSEILTQMFIEGRLAVLNIYIDEDIEAWRRSLGEYPTKWINAYNEDLTLRNGDTYDIRAIPSLYLLDKNKRVIFKDISPKMLMLKIQSPAFS